ncbi:hypothetical protein LTR93_011595 [Exophiala xenobiotica]|nr:hypothetical protein LTR93_011595 [Exophiala xenobiotica]
MKKGGCSAIKSPGVASVVGLCDLVHASQTNSQLLLLVMSPPPLHALQDVRQFLAGCDDHRPPSMTLWGKLPVEPVRKTALLRVIEAMLTVTDALEHHLHGSPPPIALADIINARNDAQYLLLCLPPAFPADIPTLSDSKALNEHIYEILRIALRIYSNLVLFPMDPAGGTSRILAAALKEAMIRCGRTCLVQSLPKSCLQPLLWALMLGGLQSDDGILGAESERVWYLERFGTFSQLTGIRTWEQVIASHSAIMWSDLVLTVAAFEFWSHSDGRTVQFEEDGLD